MRSDICLLNQAKANGYALKHGKPIHASIANVLAQKYKPCRDCEQGKKIKKNMKNMDKDVNQLKEKLIAGNEQTKNCPGCPAGDNHRPLSEFNRNASAKDGFQTYCKKCHSRIQAKRYKQKIFIDHIAPNIEPKSIGDAINKDNMSKIKQVISTKSEQTVDTASNRKCQICKGTYPIIYDFQHEPNICDMCWEADKHMNTPIPPPAPEIIRAALNLPEEKPILRTCNRCHWTGPEKKFHKAGLSGYVDICLGCVSKQRVANRQARKKETILFGLNDVLLTFYDYPDILKHLTDAARRNFRTLANEIMYRLVNTGDSHE